MLTQIEVLFAGELVTGQVELAGLPAGKIPGHVDGQNQSDYDCQPSLQVHRTSTQEGGECT